MTFSSGSDFVGLRPAGDAFRATVGDHMVGGHSNGLFGGAGLALATAALEAATGRPPTWVTAQFAAAPARGAELDLDVTITAAGRRIAQAEVTILDGDALAIRALGATGTRTEHHRYDASPMPSARPPAESELVVRSYDEGSVHDCVEVRMAHGMFGFTGTGTPSGDATTLQWLRMPGVPHDAVAIALMGDYMVSALGNGLGEMTSASSLDNTIRFLGPVDPGNDWLLLESRVHAVGNGLGTGTGLLWRSDGVLQAVASQTFTVFPMPSA